MSFLSDRFLLLASLGLLLAPVSAGAETPEELRVDEVEVTATALPTPPPVPTVDEAPTAFATTIRLDDRAGEARDVASLLLEAPGARVHHAPGGRTLMLRGTSSEQSLVLLDGIPLNAVAGGGVDLRTVPAPLLESLTVLRGNAGARYGPGALGGAALLQTRALRDEAGGTVSLSAGSFGTMEASGAAWGGGRRASGLASITLRRSEGDYDAIFDPTRQFDPSDRTVEQVGNNDDRGAGGLFKGRVELGAGAALHGLVQGWLGERGLPGTFYRRDDHRRHERRVVSALRLEFSPDADWRLDAGIDLRHDEVAVHSDTARGVAANPHTDQPGLPWQQEDALTLRLGAEAAPVAWALVRANVDVGSDWLDSPFHGDASRERVGAGLLPEIYLGDHVSLAPALRWDRVGEHEGFSPAAGIAWRPVAPIELRANWGRTFRAPSFGELYLEQASIKANPDLQPETGWTAEAGVVLRLPRLHAQLVGFHARVEDLIVYEVVSGGISKPFNVHDALVQGGEVEFRWQPLHGWQASGSWSLSKTTNLRDDPRYVDKELAFRPPHRLHLRIGFYREDWESWLEGSHQSSQYLNRANTDELPAGTSFGAGAGVRLVEAPWAIWLSGRVENAFDAHLIDQLGFPRPGRAFTLTLRADAPGAQRGPLEI